MVRYGLLLGVAVLVTLPAFAQNRTFVSSTGLDSNPCSRPAPCRSFGTAISAVAGGGEVVVLDSAGYGAATIDKSVSLIAPAGIYAGVSVSSGDGIAVNGNGIYVTLRGLNITGLGGSNGIDDQFSYQVLVEQCEISGFSTGHGVLSTNFSGGLILRDCEIRDNLYGLSVDADGAMNVSVDRTRFDHNDGGVQFFSGVVATIRDSVFYYGGTGVYLAAITANTEVTLETCMASNFSTAAVTLVALPTFTSTVRMSASTIVNNAAAMNKGGGTVTFVSFGNNRFDGNGTDATVDTLIALK